jgi:protein required for attachment to host cells
MNTVWVLVCDTTEGRLFQVRHLRGVPSAWQLVETFSHAASRSKASELVSDRMGQRSSEGRSSHQNSLAPATSPKEVDNAHFAHQLATSLEHARLSKGLRRWVLVAPPHFMGLVKNEFSPELEKDLMATFDEDLAHLDQQELAKRLRDDVRIPVDQVDVIREPKKHAH